MPPSHQQYLEWNGDRFRQWAKRIGSSTYQTVDAILTSKLVEQQSYPDIAPVGTSLFLQTTVNTFYNKILCPSQLP